MNQTELHQSLVDFVYFENNLLDERRFEEWFDLFAEDGVYWVPTRPDQTDHRKVASLALENKLLLRLRIDRLHHVRAHSLSPQVRSMRVVQRPRIERDHQDDLHSVSCNVMYMETQGQDQIVLGARVHYRLRHCGERRQIVEKRIHLLNADAALPAIQLFL